MKFSHRVIVPFLLFTTVILAAERKRSSTYRSAESKIEHLEQNARSQRINPAPTVLTTPEINAYINEGEVNLPRGVHKVKFTSQPGTVHATAEIDFDEVTSGRTGSNPLMMVFTGRHEVDATARAYGGNGRGIVHVDLVQLDGVPVPQRLLQYFSDRYLKPRYGNNVGVDSNFALPVRINSAGVGENQVTVIQR